MPLVKSRHIMMRHSTAILQTAVDRKVIKTAYLELEIGEGKFEKIVFDITRLAEKNGGFVSHTQSYSDSDGKLTSGSITIRIPA